MNATTDQAQEHGHDLQLLTAGETVEYLARMLGAAVNKLGGTMVVTSEDLRELDVMRLEHGKGIGAYAVRLVPKEDEAAGVAEPAHA